MRLLQGEGGQVGGGLGLLQVLVTQMGDVVLVDVLVGLHLLGALLLHNPPPWRVALQGLVFAALTGLDLKKWPTVSGPSLKWTAFSRSEIDIADPMVNSACGKENASILAK